VKSTPAACKDPDDAGLSRLESLLPRT